MRIGVGITTFERFDRFKECFEHILKNRGDISEILIVDDSSVKDRERYDKYFDTFVLNNINVIIKKKRTGVADSKNRIMKHFYEKGFDYWFIVEDDVNVQSKDAFEKYISVAKKTGLPFLAKGNINSMGIKPESDGLLDLYPTIGGGFTMYTPEVIEKVGYYDTGFFNSWENSDYLYRLSLAMPDKYKFWKFPDVAKSQHLTIFQEDCDDDSPIKTDPRWKFRMQKGDQYFQTKHGKFVRHIPK